ncbi:MAG: type sorting protein [Segetibacter sp.]|nr:type sorting protein [Segetibacter sp.]
MKRIVAAIFLLFFFYPAFSSHITGGELIYQYIGPGNNPNTAKYRIILRLFRDCFTNGPLLEGEQVRVGIYSNNILTSTLPLGFTGSLNSISLTTNTIACLTGTPRVCYQIATYTNTVDLPIITGFYTLATSSCCRIGGIGNITASQGVGATYTTQIPGTTAIGNGYNSSPEFLLKDTALVCANRSFKLPFGAIDANSDSLSYSFCPAYGSLGNGNQLPGSLNFNTVNYFPPYGGLHPLGPNVTINANTGIISGRAPNTGKYVVAVCVNEYRKGTLINQHRKDFILSVQACDYVSAELETPRIVCEDFSVGFENISYSNLQMQYYWDFGDPSTSGDTSMNPTPLYTYTDTGLYTVKLKVTDINGCADSTEGTVAVYPGFTPNFIVRGSCISNPVNFIDVTTSPYGEINKWKWNFGDPNVASDSSAVKNPIYQYTAANNYNVSLIVQSTKGCSDTVIKTIPVLEKPFLSLPFSDTLTCGQDSITIQAAGIGNFSWTPTEKLSGGNSSSPTFFPTDTTTYYVTMNEFGCIAKDTLTINVLKQLSLKATENSAVCTGDSIILTINSTARQFVWSPALYLNNPTFQSPVSRPHADIKYRVSGKLGKCETTDSISLKVNPYPVVNAGKDLSICAGSNITLDGSITADHFKWTPTNNMANATTLSPFVSPASTTTYVLTASNNTGCLKPASDTVIVSVIPRVAAFAGNDTIVVVGQTVQLNATGGKTYQWSPSFGLNNSHIANPVFNVPANMDSIKYRVLVTASSGCMAEDEITIRFFKTAPQVFVPSAFTPNSDGKNDILKPILVGIKKLDFFKIFDRWGQMIFNTSEHDKGWNGRLAGTTGQSGTYVYYLQATDYTGKVITQKGTSVLMR